MNTISTVPINLVVEKDLAKDFQDMCQRMHRTPSDYMQDEIRRLVAYDRWYRQKVQEGIDAANRGDMIDGEEVNKWLDSWGTDHEYEPDFAK